MNVEITDPWGFIYLTTNNVNGKRYIGQKNFDKRSRWKKYLGSGMLLARAVKKYGRVNFSREIIAITYSKEESDLLEIEFIKNHRAVESDDYYNICYGGQGTTGLYPSEETKQKISEATKGKNNHNYGKKPSEETRQRHSDANKGKIRSEESRKRYSEARRKFRGTPNDSGIKRKITPEQAIEIREKYATKNYKQIELAEEYKVTQGTIHDVINYKNAYKQIA